eukprot:10737812-Heterocapsa_arctica.AAC.1
MDNQHPEERAEQDQDSHEGAMRTNMTMDEERTITEWIDANPMIKDNVKFEDEDMLKITDKLTVQLEYVQKGMFKAMVGGEVDTFNIKRAGCLGSCCCSGSREQKSGDISQRN